MTEHHFPKSLTIGERINNLWVVAQSNKGLSEVALECGDWPATQALAPSRPALDQTMQDRDGIADTLLLLSQATQARGDRSAVRRYLEQVAAHVASDAERLPRGACSTGRRSPCWKKAGPWKPDGCADAHARSCKQLGATLDLCRVDRTMAK